LSVHLLIVASPYEAEILRRAAVREGFQVTICDPAEASEALLHERADAAIVSPPADSPSDLCQILRTQPGGAGLCVVAVGAPSTHADAVIARPLDPEVALYSVRSLLHRTAQPSPEAPSIDDALEGQLRALWSSMVTPHPEAGVTDPQAVPHWRAVTQVLPARGPAGASSPVPPSTPVPAPPAGSGPAAASEDDGAFAQRVKSTLSAIEQRLFPNSPPVGFPTPPVDNALLDIDLDALDLAALAVPDFEVTFDDEDVASPVVTPQVTEDARDAIVEQTNVVAVHRTEPPRNQEPASEPARTPAPTPAPSDPARAPEVSETASEPQPSEPARAHPPGSHTDVLTAPGFVRAGAPLTAQPTPPMPPAPPTPPPEVAPAASVLAVALATAPAPAFTPTSPPPPQRGSLADTDLAQLLHRVRREGLTGRLRLRRADMDKSIFFEDGIPVFATSNLPHDRLGDLLFREGKITRAQYEESRRVVDESGRRMASVLIDLKLLKPQELFPTVRRHVEDIIYSLFAWIEGEFELLPGAEPPKGQKVRLGAHPDALIVDGIRRKLGLERLIERVGAEDTILHPLSADLQAALVDAALDEPERQTLALIDGQRSLGDLCAAGPLDETGVYQLAYALVALGLARLERKGPRTEAARVEPDRDRSIDHERIVAKHALVEESDYFNVLGLDRDATDYEIRRAYDAACHAYAPESFPPDLAAEHAAELATIAKVLEEAYAVLRDPALRAAYRAHLRDPK